jgi:hypothetical protein
MHKSLLVLLAVATVLSAAAVGSQATAMPAARLPRGAATAGAVPVWQVRTICGINGCAPVFTKRIQKPPRKFTSTAAPLVVSGTPAPAPAPAAASTKPWPLSLLH